MRVLYGAAAYEALTNISVSAGNRGEKEKGMRGLYTSLTAAATLGLAMSAGAFDVDCTASGGPDMDIKRGRSCALDASGKIGLAARMGFELVHLHQHMVDPTSKWDEPLDQFYINDNGWYAVRVNDGVVEARMSAASRGLQVIHQATGTPYYGLAPFGATGTTELWPMLLSRVHGGGSANWYPLPATLSDREHFGTKLANWMKKVEEADGAMKSIWIGNQEPSHTVGFPLNADGSRDSNSNVLKNENITLYIETWKNTAKDMRKAGYQVGGIQLNGSNAKNMDHAVKTLQEKGCPFDYFTVQQYKGDRTNDEILSSVRAALVKYGYDTNKKLLFNRYQMLTAAADSSSSMVNYLKAEKLLLDNADMVYGVCFEGAMFTSDIWVETYEFIHNDMVKTRRPMSGLPDGVDGFVGADETKFTAVLWNKSGEEKSVWLHLLNNGTNYNSGTLTIRQFRGTTVSDASADWLRRRNKIANVLIPNDGYVLLTLE